MTRTKLFQISPWMAISAALLACVWVACLSLASVGAISNIAPDPSEYGSASGDIRLTLTNTAQTKNVTTITLPVYVDAPADAVSSSIRAEVKFFDWYQTYAGTQNDYRVRFDDGVNSLCRLGRQKSNSYDMTISNFHWDPDHKLWYATVTATLRNKTPSDGCGVMASRAKNSKIDFRMQIQSFSYTTASNPTRQSESSDGRALPQGNSWIAYAVPNATDPDADNYYFSTDARSWGANHWANYKLKFATPSTITTPVDGTIFLYDLDSVPRGEPSDTAVYDNTDNGPRGTNREVIVTVKDLTQPGNPNMNVRYSRASTKGDNQIYRVTMRFEPEHRYQLEVNRIYYYNVLQYRLPFNNIAYITGCGTPTPGTLNPILDLSRDSVSHGDTFTSYFRAQNTALAEVPVITEARIWYDNGNSQFDAGEYEEYHMLTPSGSPDRAAANTMSTLKQRDVTVDATHGSNICVSWQLQSTTTPNVAVDDDTLVECMPINQSPFVQIWGNDLRIGGRFSSDTTTDTSGALVQTVLMQASSGRYYGSWAEYGIMAPGTVGSMASGAGLATGNDSNDQANWSGLTFANSPDLDCPSVGGCFTDNGANMGTIPDVAAAVTAGANGPFIGITPTSADCTNIHMASFTGSHIIRCSGTATITGDIEMAPGPYASGESIPQLIIVADAINIQGNVRRVDAWLVASGTINTCSDGPDDLTINDCRQTLDINGPTMARTLIMRRTAGAGTASAASYAERFNLRADTYVWAYSQAQRSATMRTTYTRELAPRY